MRNTTRPPIFASVLSSKTNPEFSCQRTDLGTKANLKTGNQLGGAYLLGPMASDTRSAPLLIEDTLLLPQEALQLCGRVALLKQSSSTHAVREAVNHDKDVI